MGVTLAYPGGSKKGEMIFLTSDELQKPHKASEFEDWVSRKIEEISSTKEGRNALRLREGLAKNLMEEAYPLSLFASKFFDRSEEVTLQILIGNQNFDAIVQDGWKEKGLIQYVEVTQAHEGEDFHLRMINLCKEGSVSAIGKVNKQGTKRTGLYVSVENEARLHSDIVDEELKRIGDALKRKIGKIYPQGTALVVAFDDYVAITKPSDLVLLKNSIDHFHPELSKFVLLFLIGISGKNYLTFFNKPQRTL